MGGKSDWLYYVAVNLLIPIAFVLLGVFARMLAAKKFEWSHLFLGMELMLATFTASASHLLDQQIKDKQYRNEEDSIIGAHQGTSMPADVAKRHAKIRERRAALENNQQMAMLTLLGSVFGVFFVTFIHQQHEGQPTTRSVRFLLGAAFAGVLVLIAFLLAIKGIVPEPLL
jgi:hypothetical protein